MALQTWSKWPTLQAKSTTIKDRAGGSTPSLPRVGSLVFVSDERNSSHLMDVRRGLEEHCMGSKIFIQSNQGLPGFQ